MAWTTDDVDTLKAAIATGALRVKYADRDVEYRSLKEMRETLALIDNEASGRSAPRVHFATFNRGHGRSCGGDE